MALTKERADKLTNYLNEDPERAKRLVALTAEEAVAEMNGDGYDFTAEELEDFAEQMQAMAGSGAPDGELGEEALGNVAGGAFVTMSVLAMTGALWWANSRKRR